MFILEVYITLKTLETAYFFVEKVLHVVVGSAIIKFL